MLLYIFLIFVVIELYLSYNFHFSHFIILKNLYNLKFKIKFKNYFL